MLLIVRCILRRYDSIDQRDVNKEVATILNNHVGRTNAIFFMNIASILLPQGATKHQVREAIRQQRCHRKPISSRPNVGYYIDSTEMKGCRTWVENFRIARKIAPITPASLKWV